MRTILAGGIFVAVLGLVAGTAMAAYTGQVQGSTLKLTGDSASDTLVLHPNGTTLAVDVGVDGTVDFTFDEATFSAVSIAAGGGDDEVTLGAAAVNDKAVTVDGGSGDDTLRGGAGAETLLGNSGNDVVDGNQGADTALLGSGNDRFNWDPGDGSDTVEGQGNSDTLDFNGANIGEIFDVFADGGRVRFTRNIANITMDLDDVEAFNLRALGGTDQLTVDDMTGTNLRTADADLGGDAVPDTVIVNGSRRAASSPRSISPAARRSTRSGSRRSPATTASRSRPVSPS
jgi:hemolysin type calcium-binding protein